MFTSIHISRYKSLYNIGIKNPSPFSVFVGPNGAGKSNIFETLDFVNTAFNYSTKETLRLFGGFDSLHSKKTDLAKNYTGIFLKQKDKSVFAITVNPISINWTTDPGLNKIHTANIVSEPQASYGKDRINREYKGDVLLSNFSRIFINNPNAEKIEFKDDDQRLSTACGNLEKVLKRILKDENKREEIVEWLQLLVPGFENIEIKSEELSGSDNLLIYEKGSNKPFNKSLISDGTYNIIALLTAVYQSDEPQFLCIEEPENGLNPKVVRELVGFFREQCETKGHYIWLNTHSQTLVSELTSEEIILVDKKNGETQIKQIKGKDLHGLRMDEALLSGVLGGGNPW